MDPRRFRRPHGPERPPRLQGRELCRDDKAGPAGPTGVTITTEACRAFLAAGTFPDGLLEEREVSVRRLEAVMDRRLGDPVDPLLVSVRSGARFSMPGMMETVLNIGLGDESVARLGRHQRQRAVRPGLLSPAAPDVRRHGAGHRLRGLRRRAGCRQGGPQGRGRRGARRRRSARARGDVPARHPRAHGSGHPAGPAHRSWSRPCSRSSTPGTPSGPASTAARNASPSTSEPR